MVQWDAFAALVALVGIPLMVSPNFIQVLKYIYKIIYKFMYPATARCERLQWSDVPDGPLNACENDCDGYSKIPQDASCIRATLGTVFQRTWTSPTRRDKYVAKPKQLDLGTNYVRVDAKLIRAFLLLNQYNGQSWERGMIRFHIIDGVLTAHLQLKSCEPWMHTCAHTKREVDLILDGYPPQYTETISIPQEILLRPSTQVVSVPSPIETRSDIYRGGWVIGAALDYSRSKEPALDDALPGSNPWPSIGHAMEPTSCTLPSTISGVVQDFMPRQKAVFRVRHALEKIRQAFPEQGDLVKTALIHIHRLFSEPIGGAHPEVSIFDRPVSELASGLPYPSVFSGSHARSIAISLPPLGGSKLTEILCFRNFRTRLSGLDWMRVMKMFNSFAPFSTDDVDFLQPKLVEVLQAAVTGVWDLLVDFGKADKTHLPEISELDGHRYVYVYDCNKGQRHDDEEL